MREHEEANAVQKNKNEYNSVRRRKLFIVIRENNDITQKIRMNITP